MRVPRPKQKRSLNEGEPVSDEVADLLLHRHERVSMRRAARALEQGVPASVCHICATDGPYRMTISPWLPLGIGANKTKGAMAVRELASFSSSGASASLRLSLVFGQRRLPEAKFP